VSQAACRAEPTATFFPTVEHPIAIGLRHAIRTDPWERARRICGSCPVWEQCLDEALLFHPNEDFGFRGRHDPYERRKLRKQRRRVAG
jgi:hypothetical protein